MGELYYYLRAKRVSSPPPPPLLSSFPQPHFITGRRSMHSAFSPYYFKPKQPTRCPPDRSLPNPPPRPAVGAGHCPTMRFTPHCRHTQIAPPPPPPTPHPPWTTRLGRRGMGRRTNIKVESAIPSPSRRRRRFEKRRYYLTSPR